MLSWLYLFIAIALEVSGTICIKFSEGLTTLIPAGLLYASCTGFLVLALKEIELTVAYSIWAGLGAVLVTSFGIFALHESVSLFKLVGIGLTIIGIVGLKLGSRVPEIPEKKSETSVASEKHADVAMESPTEAILSKTEDKNLSEMSS